MAFFKERQYISVQPTNRRCHFSDMLLFPHQTVFVCCGGKLIPEHIFADGWYPHVDLQLLSVSDTDGVSSKPK